MKLEQDSSINIENNGCNQGVQVGNNSGNITVNHGPSEADMKKFMEMISDSIRKSQNENPSTAIPEKKKWFRSDTQQAVKSDDLIKIGNTTAQIDGSVMRMETSLPDHQTVYAEFDMDKNMVSNIVAEGFPQEYTVNIPKELLVDTRSFQMEIEGQVYNAKCDKLKFGGEMMALYDIKENKLQSISAKAPAGMRASVNPLKKEVTFIKAESALQP